MRIASNFCSALFCQNSIKQLLHERHLQIGISASVINILFRNCFQIRIFLKSLGKALNLTDFKHAGVFFPDYPAGFDQPMFLVQCAKPFRCLECSFVQPEIAQVPVPTVLRYPFLPFASAFMATTGTA